MKIEEIAKRIDHFNGNPLVVGELNDGKELTLMIHSPGLGENELIDYSTGLIYTEKNFKSFRNFSNHFVYRETKNHDAREPGKFLQGGQNLHR